MFGIVVNSGQKCKECAKSTEAIAFETRFDYPATADKTVKSMLNYLENNFI